MVGVDAAPGCITADLECSSSSEAAAAAFAVCDAADALADGGALESALDTKSVDAWLGLCKGLTKSPCLESSTTEPTLSEVSSSSVGGLTPRRNQESTVALQQVTPLRWADETEAEMKDYAGALENDDMRYDDQDDLLETGPDPTTPSKRGSRRSNRRRRARAEKAAATQAGLLVRASPGAYKEVRPAPLLHSPAGRLSGIRNSVTVGDLLCGSPCQASSGRFLGHDEAAWFQPASPCRAQVAGSRGIMSTSPCGAPVANLSFGFDSYMTGCPQSPYTQPFYAVADGAGVWGPSSPTSPPCSRPSGVGMLGTTPKASSRTPPPLAPLPVGPVENSNFKTTPLSSPCHARAGGIISTSPTSTGDASYRRPSDPGQLAIGGEVCSVDPAGSPNGDALRSWLHASGLPSCADLTYQLKANAQEVYED